MGYLKKYIKKYYRLFFVAIAFLSVEAACDIFQPTLMSKIVDIGIKNRNLHYVLMTGGVMLLVTGIGAVGAVVRNNISSRVSQRFGAELRFDLFSKIQRFSYEDAGKFETSSLVTRLTNDVTQMQNFVNGMMRIFVKAPLICVGSIIMATILDPKLSVIIAVIVPVIVLIIYINTHVAFPFFKKVQRAIDRLNGVMREYLSGVRVIKAFNRFDYEEKRFDSSNEELSNVQIKAMKINAVFSPMTATAINIGIIAVLWFGSFAIDTGSLQVGKIIAFVNYMTQMSNSIMTISMVFNMFVRARTSAERIGEVMNVKNKDIKLSGGAGKAVGQPEKTDGAGIEFRDVSFSYSGNLTEPVLRHISFSCKPGTTLGIIGTTGSGKTSIVNLIVGFYEATQGAVMVNGADVRCTDEHELRGRIAVVPQKSTLFSGSIIDNIRWGNEKASAGEVEKAAKIAQAHDFITAMPEGYDTMLGQGGVNLSGGQKQRISIARALVKNPEILILDDCTSAVDVISESKIRRGLKEYSKSLICVMVTQRISAVMESDRILVLDDGEINGMGSHDELMSGCSIYREIYESQLGKAEIPWRK